MVDREAFENYIRDTFVQQKKNGSEVMTRSRGAEIVGSDNIGTMLKFSRDVV